MMRTLDGCDGGEAAGALLVAEEGAMEGAAAVWCDEKNAEEEGACIGISRCDVADGGGKQTRWKVSRWHGDVVGVALVEALVCACGRREEAGAPVG